MITGRRSTDWLKNPNAVAEAERRGADRRNTDRRAPRRRYDPLFLVTLVNQVASTPTHGPCAYAPSEPPRRGIVVNFRT